MPQIGRLWTDLELESSQFTVGLRKAVAESTAASTKIQKSLSAVRASIALGAASIAGLGLLSAAREALDYASSLGETAQQLGVTARALQEYRYVATQVGVSEQEMDKALQKLTRTMGEARNGSKAQAAAFRELNGLIGRDILKSANDAGDAIPLISQALSKIEDPARRARIETQLFGRAGQQLDPLLSGGSAAVNELRDAAHSLGIVLSDEAIDNADRTADKLSELNTVISANIASAVAENTREIYGFVDALSAMLARIPAVIRGIENFRDRLVIGTAAARTAFESALNLPGNGTGGAGEARDASARIRTRNAAARRDSAALRLERMGFVVPRNPDGTINEAGIRRGSMRRGGGTSANGDTPAAAASSGRGSRSRADRSADEAERNRIRYERDIADLRADDLRLRREMAGDVREQARLSHATIALDRERWNDDIAQRVKDKELTAEQARALGLQRDLNDDREHALINRQLDDDLQREENDLARAGLDAQAGLLRGALDAARTEAERRDIQLKLLDLEYQQQRLALEETLASKTATDAQKRLAQARLDALAGQQAVEADGIRRDTMGPLARYLDEIPRSARETAEAYERIAAQGLDDFTDSLVDAATGAKSLKDAFSDMAGSILRDLLRIAVQQQIVKPLAASLFGATGDDGMSSGGLFGRLFGASKGLVEGDQASSMIAKVLSGGGVRIPGLATGGSFMVGGTPGIDRNVLSINGRPRAMVSSSERIDVSPPKLRAANDAIFVTIAADEGAAFVPRVTDISRGESAGALGKFARAQGRARRRSLR